jgi:RimJ/RimL family protein N-acetyltransferase
MATRVWSAVGTPSNTPPNWKTRLLDTFWRGRKQTSPVFAILQGIGRANQCIRLRRIAVQNAGHGVGSRLLRSVLEVCFGDLAAHRVELLVFQENERAHRAYLKTGFLEEGLIRDLHRDDDGGFRSMRLMSLLRPEWAARR